MEATHDGEADILAGQKPLGYIKFVLKHDAMDPICPDSEAILDSSPFWLSLE